MQSCHQPKIASQLLLHSMSSLLCATKSITSFAPPTAPIFCARRLVAGHSLPRHTCGQPHLLRQLFGFLLTLGSSWCLVNFCSINSRHSCGVNSVRQTCLML